jgi:hypothetical protein
MIIDDDYKWDKLIIVCYPGGFGGDFFCNLLHMNYDPNHKFSPNVNNRYEWNFRENATYCIAIKKINNIFTYYKAIKNNREAEFLAKESIWASEFSLETMKKIMAITYDENFDLFKKNYIKLVRNFMCEDQLKKRCIINTHSFQNNLSISEIFPESVKIVLFAEKYEYALLNSFLGRIKNVPVDENKKNLQNASTSEKKIIDILNLDIKAISRLLSNPYVDTTGIDVGKLFFENGEYVSEVENLLSTKLNRKIVLDKNLIQKYKKDNMSILGKTFNIKNADELTPKELLDNILSPHLTPHFYVDKNYDYDKSY